MFFYFCHVKNWILTGLKYSKFTFPFQKRSLKNWHFLQFLLEKQWKRRISVKVADDYSMRVGFSLWWKKLMLVLTCIRWSSFLTVHIPSFKLSSKKRSISHQEICLLAQSLNKYIHYFARGQTAAFLGMCCNSSSLPSGNVSTLDVCKTKNGFIQRTLYKMSLLYSYWQSTLPYSYLLLDDAVNTRRCFNCYSELQLEFHSTQYK